MCDLGLFLRTDKMVGGKRGTAKMTAPQLELSSFADVNMQTQRHSTGFMLIR
jgi:hypothetical protein